MDGDRKSKRVLLVVIAFVAVWLPLTLVALVAVARNRPIPSWDRWLLTLGFWAIVVTVLIRFLLRRKSGRGRRMP
jgi:hypothetical protein